MLGNSGGSATTNILYYVFNSKDKLNILFFQYKTKLFPYFFIAKHNF